MKTQNSIHSCIQTKVGRTLLPLSSALFLAAGGASQAAVYHVTYSGTAWGASQMASGDYASVAGRSTSNSDAYAAKRGAGVDLISGGTVSLGLSTNYKSLSALTNNSGFMWGANTSGGVDYLNYFGGWVASPLVSGSYLSVSTNTNGNNNVYASKASGGIDWITYTGGGGTGWGASTLLSTSTIYVDIAPTYGTDAYMWGVTAAGAINKIEYSGGWVETAIVAGNYISVANAGANGFAYAARADGGIDYITYTGGGATGWGSSTLFSSSTVYNDLAADLQGNGFMFASAVPEPSTLSVVLVGAGLLLPFRRRLR
jgi:hypothetical protein